MVGSTHAESTRVRALDFNVSATQVARCHFNVRAKKGTLLPPKNCEHGGFSLVLFCSVLLPSD